MSQASPPAKNLRVFVVEDHADTLRFLSGHLRRRGHEVATATGVEEALQALPGFSCEVLLSDIGLKDGNGWELLQRAQLPPSVFAIAMSGFGTHEDKLRSAEVGFRVHLVKPFSVADLNALLDEAAANWESRRNS